MNQSFIDYEDNLSVTFQFWLRQLAISLDEPA